MNTAANMLAKVRSLFTLADHPNTPTHEADAARAMATRLMVKHAIDAANLGDAADPAEFTTDTYTIHGPHHVARGGLFVSLGKAFGVAIVRDDRTRHLAGRRSAIDSVLALYALLDTQRAAELRRADAARTYQDRTFARSFLLGFNNAAGKRIAEAVNVAREESGPGAGLVLASDFDRARQMLSDRLGPFRTSYTTPGGRGGAAAGSAAGSRADIGSARLGGGRQAIGAGS